MQFENWLVFCTIALMGTAAPGPAALLVSLNSLSFGLKKSLITVLGNITGLLIMSTLSILGLSAVVLHSSVGFYVIKLLGAGYLAYIGLNFWINGVGIIELDSAEKLKGGSMSLYSQGILVALTNPKAVIFTTALFPQFIVTTASLFYQFSILVLSFMSLSFICLSVYALVAQRAWANTMNVRIQKLIGKIFGVLFISAGCMLVTTLD